MTQKRVAPFHERFIAEYLLDLNGTQAYLRAKRHRVKATTARVEATRLLAVPAIAARVRDGKAAQMAALDMSAQNVLALLWSAASLDPKEMFDDGWRLLPLSQMSVAARRTIEGIELARANLDRTDGHKDSEWLQKIKGVSKSKALELLCKHFGLIADRVEVEFEAGALLEAARARARARCAKGAKGAKGGG